MTNPFDVIREEKRIRILNAAFQVFAKHGYEQASTNQIVKLAQIGKGTLFHYFHTKEELFQYLISHAIQFITENYVEQVNINEPDFIERMKQMAKLKMKVYKAHPDLFHFIGMIYMNEPEHFLSSDVKKQLNDLRTDGFAKLYKNIDTRLLKDEIDTDKALKLIKWSIDGYQQELIGLLTGKDLYEVDFDPYWDEFQSYLETLKTAYYK